MTGPCTHPVTRHDDLLGRVCEECRTILVDPWRWTSAVWPSGNNHRRHAVVMGSPFAVCGHRPQRIDGERWYKQDYTEREKCAKCLAWEASIKPTDSPLTPPDPTR